MAKELSFGRVIRAVGCDILVAAHPLLVARGVRRNPVADNRLLIAWRKHVLTMVVPPGAESRCFGQL